METNNNMTSLECMTIRYVINQILKSIEKKEMNEMNEPYYFTDLCIVLFNDDIENMKNFLNNN